LTPQQAIRARRENKKGDAKALEPKINSNLRLVVTIAQDYANLGLPPADLISEAGSPCF
jgi:RNA polymerase primary sigma factor